MDAGLGVLLLTLGGTLVTAGAAWGGAKTALNGTRKRVYELHTELREHTESDSKVQREMLDRLIRIETKIEERR